MMDATQLGVIVGTCIGLVIYAVIEAELGNTDNKGRRMN